MTTTIDNNALHGSVASGKFTLVQKFITNGCDPDTPHSISGLRPIHIAASRGHLKLVQYLYEKTHCNVDAMDKEGEVNKHTILSDQDSKHFVLDCNVKSSLCRSFNRCKILD